MTQRWLLAVLAFFMTFTDLAGAAPKKPATVAELALYSGPDRQEILEEGAKKEGKAKGRAPRWIGCPWNRPT